MIKRINIPMIVHRAGGITNEAFLSLCDLKDKIDPEPRRIILSVNMAPCPN